MTTKKAGNKYLCIHGHFYQPPRENAWLEAIEWQQEAHPFHDWNERITQECYGPNARSRILSEDKQIVDITNNYARISFNYGPTLLSWMESETPDVYQLILDADRQSMERFGGHGSALAQVYNHMIMPLANARDKITQVVWGIRDFQQRFNRKPEGMWLAETAVDLETLEVLADHEIRFTILAARQAKSVKPMTTGSWERVQEDTLEFRRPYICRLPSGKQMVLFFYDPRVSQQVAFQDLLKDGRKFAKSMLDRFHGDTKAPQLVHIATDGESYGHHKRHGDMALAYSLNTLEQDSDVQLTNYAQYLDLFPPEWQVKIHENSSWSCVHGVERWRSDCGCSGNHDARWNQKWREPLRAALDWLRDAVAPAFARELEVWVRDPWAVRNEYIDVIMDRRIENVDGFVEKHCGSLLEGEAKTRFLRLLEIQRQAMLMYTSCGWFFDDVSGIETLQILQYANRAMQLAERETDLELETEFRRLLEKVPSNLTGETGASLYAARVAPRRLTLTDVAAHHAVASLFEEEQENIKIWNYRGRSEILERYDAGNHRLALGYTVVHSRITHSVKGFAFVVLHLGQNNILGQMSTEMTVESFEPVKNSLAEAFRNGAIPELLTLMHQHFGEQQFSMASLLRDERRKVVMLIMQDNLEDAEDEYKKIFNRNYSLVNILGREEMAIPDILRRNQEIVINNELVNFFGNGRLHPKRLEKLGREATKWQIALNKAEIAYAASRRIHTLVQELRAYPNDRKLTTTIRRVLQSLKDLDVEIDLWQIQNAFFRMMKECRQKENLEHASDSERQIWVQLMRDIGELIQVKVD